MEDCVRVKGMDLLDLLDPRGHLYLWVAFTTSVQGGVKKVIKVDMSVSLVCVCCAVRV